MNAALIPAVFFDVNTNKTKAGFLASIPERTKPWFHICFLDARQIPLLGDIINQIKRVKASAGHEAVLFLLSYPVQQLQLWRSVLIRAFSKKAGYANVIHYYVDCNDDESGIGQAAICVGEMTGNAKLSHVQFVHAPPAQGCAPQGCRNKVVWYKVGSTREGLYDGA